MAQSQSEILASLRDAIRAEKRPAVFIGSGLSRPPYPDWNEFLVSLARVVNHADVAKLNGADLQLKLLIAQECKEQMTRGHFAAFMRDTFTRKEPPEIFRTIVTLPFAFFVTTNYDCNIEKAYEEMRGQKLECVIPSRPERALELLADNGMCQQL